MFAEDFIQPTWVWLLVFCGNNLDDVALLELGAKADHFAVYDSARTSCANVTVETIGKI